MAKLPRVLAEHFQQRGKWKGRHKTTVATRHRPDSAAAGFHCGHTCSASLRMYQPSQLGGSSSPSWGWITIFVIVQPDIHQWILGKNFLSVGAS